MCERLLGGVSDRQRNIFGAERFGDDCCLAMELDSRALASRSHHFNVAPSDSAAPSRTQRFHPCFFCSETGGVALESSSLALAVSDLAFRKYSLKEAVTEALDTLANARDFSDVDAGAEDHGCIVKGRIVFCNYARIGA